MVKRIGDLPPLPAPEPDPGLVAEAVRTQDPTAFFAIGLSLCEAERQRLRAIAADADADREAEALDNTAWQRAQLRDYGDSKDELSFVRAFKQAARGEPGDIDDHSDAALDGYRAGERYARLLLATSEDPTLVECTGCGGEGCLEDDQRPRPYTCPECKGLGRVPLHPYQEEEPAGRSS